ncbi:unnamed protein product [Acanthocheilonema viteae]|uniref:Uncharacterized protein n=1 Tax=Acanthocheilonema viteae TaxID=6277 RepID=A0A498SQM5_ACAVI|nr:unnamed protein product [Acanthocheilonema viteae]
MVNLEENKDIDEENETNSWTTTIGTRSSFSTSYPTGEDGPSFDEEITTGQGDCNNNERSSTTSDSLSNTSSDFSSFKNLNDISEHTMMSPRADDIKWMNDALRYHEQEPVFRKKPFKAALKIRPRKVFPQLKWYRLYHKWGLRQTPQAYKGKDVPNPYIIRALEERNDVDFNLSDLERGIFYLKCTSC